MIPPAQVLVAMLAAFVFGAVVLRLFQAAVQRALDGGFVPCGRCGLTEHITQACAACRRRVCIACSFTLMRPLYRKADPLGTRMGGRESVWWCAECLPAPVAAALDARGTAP